MRERAPSSRARKTVIHGVVKETLTLDVDLRDRASAGVGVRYPAGRRTERETHPMDVDIAVVGLGSIGSMALWRLAGRRNIRVAGFEMFGPGHDRSAAGGESRIFRLVASDDSRLVPLHLHALPLWRELEQDAARELLFRTGVLVLGRSDAPGVQGAMASARDFEIEADLLDRTELVARYPQHRVGADYVGILDSQAGYVLSQLAVVSAIESAVRRGATLNSYARVVGIEPGSSRVTLRLANGERQGVRRVLLAPGPWMGPLLYESLGVTITARMLRPVQAWFAPIDPAQYAAARCPVFIHASEPHFYGFPTLDGCLIKMGLSAAAHRPVPDPDRLDRTVDVSDVSAFRDLVRDRLHGVRPDPIRLAAYMESYTPDGLPVIGALPHAPAIVLLGGFSGRGFKIAPLMGEVGAALVLGEEPPVEVTEFRVDRLVTSEAGGGSPAARTPDHIPRWKRSKDEIRKPGT